MCIMLGTALNSSHFDYFKFAFFHTMNANLNKSLFLHATYSWRNYMHMYSSIPLCGLYSQLLIKVSGTCATKTPSKERLTPYLEQHDRSCVSTSKQHETMEMNYPVSLNCHKPVVDVYIDVIRMVESVCLGFKYIIMKDDLTSLTKSLSSGSRTITPSAIIVATRPARDLISYIKLVFSEVDANNKSSPENQERINNQ